MPAIRNDHQEGAWLSTVRAAVGAEGRSRGAGDRTLAAPTTPQKAAAGSSRPDGTGPANVRGGTGPDGEPPRGLPMVRFTALREKTGEHLAKRMQEDEEAAFSEFARRYAPRFRGYLIRHGLSPTQAEDLAYTTVTEAALRIGQFENRGDRSFDRWVFTLAYHQYVAWLREQATEAEELAAATAVARRRGPRSEQSDPRLVERARAGFAMLSHRERDVLTLRLLAVPFTFAEVGKELGISESAARVCHHRALTKLRAVVQEG